MCLNSSNSLALFSNSFDNLRRRTEEEFREARDSCTFFFGPSLTPGVIDLPKEIHWNRNISQEFSLDLCF